MMQVIKDGLLAILVVGAFFSFIGGCEREKEFQDTVNALSDSVRTYQINDSITQSEKLVLSASFETLKSLSASKDSTIADLAQKLTKSTIVIAQLKVQSHGKVQTEKTDSIVYVKNDTTPTYFFSYENKHIKLNGNCSAHRFYMDYNTTENLTAELKFKRNGLFGHPVPVMTVHSDNPKTIITNIDVMMPTKKVTWKGWTYISGAAGLVAGIAIGALR